MKKKKRQTFAQKVIALIEERLDANQVDYEGTNLYQNDLEDIEALIKKLLRQRKKVNRSSP